MKKRMLAAFLALCMLIGLAPAATAAEGATAVAQIGDSTYESFNTAWETAMQQNGSITITLLSDATYDLRSLTVSNMKVKYITIDLSNCNLTIAKDLVVGAGFYAGNTLKITGEGTVIFTNNASIELDGSEGADTLIIESGTFINRNSSYAMIRSTWSNHVITISGGSYEGEVLEIVNKTPVVTKAETVNIGAPTGYYWNNDTLTEGTPDATVTIGGVTTYYLSFNDAIAEAIKTNGDVTVTVLRDSTYDSKSYTLDWNKANITLDMNGHAVILSGYILLLYGDNMTVTGNGTMTFENGGYISVSKNGVDGAAVVIKNGTFVNKNTEQYAIGAGYGASIVVNSGTFETTTTAPALKGSDGAIITLNGGTYDAGTLTVSGAPSVTKAENVVIAAPEGYAWKNGTKLVKYSAVDAVIAKINAIGTVTLDSATDIQEAETAYAALTSEQQAQVDNYTTLTEARAAYDLLTAKAYAKTELEGYKNANDYREAQQIELENAIAVGKDAIDAADDPDGVAAALDAAKVAIDSIKTDAELEAEEAANQLYIPVIPTYSVTVNETVNGTVRTNCSYAYPGTAVPVTATPDAGYTLSSLTVLDAAGNAVALVTVDGNVYRFAMPDSAVSIYAAFIKIAAAHHPFVDVPDGEWYSEGVQYVYTNGIMKGINETGTVFDLNGSTSRAMLMTMLARMSGVDTSVGNTWDEIGMNWAVAAGISDGTNGSAPITREQLVTMLYRYAGSPSVNESALAALGRYSDYSALSNWAQYAMAWAVEKGIINGIDGALSPSGTASRAEVATILMRFCMSIAN